MTRFALIMAVYVVHTMWAEAKPAIAVGAVAEKSMGASLLYLRSPYQGFHLAMQRDGARAMAATFDYHQYFSVTGARAVIGEWAHLASYVGVGVRSRATIAAGEDDKLYLRTPAGLELSIKAAPVQLLGDVAAELDPARPTSIRLIPRVGARAVF